MIIDKNEEKYVTTYALFFVKAYKRLEIEDITVQYPNILIIQKDLLRHVLLSNKNEYLFIKLLKELEGIILEEDKKFKVNIYQVLHFLLEKIRKENEKSERYEICHSVCLLSTLIEIRFLQNFLNK